ncbi:MAG: alpha/beta hydrolase-fold protein [Candidatus Acidiferrales bacterium]
MRLARAALCFAIALSFAALSVSEIEARTDSAVKPQQLRSSADDFLARSYHSPGGETMRYRLFVPPGYDATKKYPIVLWLHGAAGRGSDNLLQISGGNFPGTHVWTTEENQAKYHAFVVAPQVENTKAWSRPHVNTAPVSLRLALEILDAIEKEYSIDRDREYVAGQSMGGEGVWAALATARGRFAAAIALCGYGFDEQIAADAKVPVWIFQGTADAIVPVARAREWVTVLRKAGGTPKYTEVPGVGHAVWEKAFADPKVVSWLMSQRRAD